ncbi:hypothetical protein B0T26DRAFT_157996 [Lasiosphaeria miniovina]|uniref:Uncharacterized protein n=1 Tax=Lasiosphaeria miniovina TaxID=1954250 RepID=A0AA40B5K6_9PEZI|nr:uncharacterized protein B0T26DRAFT_157996 [Lasiosphaeria miniovina]KAK0728100.1 hypothetical protein B0T26DRAFT_157996 [Lasiosphaeria miniovina]
MASVNFPNPCAGAPSEGSHDWAGPTFWWVFREPKNCKDGGPTNVAVAAHQNSHHHYERYGAVSLEPDDHFISFLYTRGKCHQHTVPNGSSKIGVNPGNGIGRIFHGEVDPSSDNNWPLQAANKASSLVEAEREGLLSRHDAFASVRTYVHTRAQQGVHHNVHPYYTAYIEPSVVCCGSSDWTVPLTRRSLCHTSAHRLASHQNAVVGDVSSSATPDSVQSVEHRSLRLWSLTRRSITAPNHLCTSPFARRRASSPETMNQLENQNRGRTLRRGKAVRQQP